MPRIAVLFHRLGPYHHARLSAASRCADIVAIEFSKVDRTYAWSRVESSPAFEQLTIYDDKDIDTLPLTDVAYRVGGALSRVDPDVVAIPGWSHRAALSALSWCLTHRKPAIVMSASTARDEVRVWWKETIKSRLVRSFSTALAGGTAQKSYLTKLGMPEERIFVGYDVVDNDHFSRGADNARRGEVELRHQLGLPQQYFLASNRFLPKKNLITLLRAYEDYRMRAGHQAWSLVLLGDGPLRHDIIKFIETAGLGDSVMLPGFKQYNELPVYYALAGAFLHASTAEQWGLVVNEAMAAGLPVLVSRNCGCVPDLVQDGLNGFTFDPHDASELTRLMEHVSSDEGTRRAMSAASRGIIDKWSLETFAMGLRCAAQSALIS